MVSLEIGLPQKEFYELISLSSSSFFETYECSINKYFNKKSLK